jgi:excisionase family DNA binding protein
MARLLTVTQTAARLGITRTRVLALITAGRLPATRDSLSGHFRVKDVDLKLVENRKPGAPLKNKNAARNKT